MTAHGHDIPAPSATLRGNEWRSVAVLLPYLLDFRGRVLLALTLLVAAKLANVGVPLAMKGIVDELTPGLDPKLAAAKIFSRLSPVQVPGIEIGCCEWPLSTQSGHLESALTRPLSTQMLSHKSSNANTTLRRVPSGAREYVRQVRQGLVTSILVQLSAAGKEE
ncbi:MAG: hypothetical protein OEZ08_09980 [Betaproteobacteria bacterium]|nr:hypothetical protein [Betaproteobacteria bacterium]